MLKSMKHFNKISLFAHQPLFENSKAIYFICLFTLTRGMRYLFEGGAGNKKGSRKQKTRIGSAFSI